MYSTPRTSIESTSQAMSSEAENETKHIAVLAFPFGTHATHLLCLTRRLSMAAPDAQFSFFCTAKFNSSMFHTRDDKKMENIKPYDVADGLPENFVFSPASPQEPVIHFLKATPGNFERAVPLAAEETRRAITCIVGDAFLWFAADMAEELRVPWVPVSTSGPYSLLLHIETDLIRREMGFNGPEDRTLDFLEGYSAIRARDLPKGIISGNLTSPFSKMLGEIGRRLPRAAAVAADCFEELDLAPVNAAKSRVKKFLNIGPSVLISPPEFSDPEGCVEWLDRHGEQSVVYISFLGTMSSPEAHELVAIAEALELSGKPFLWALRGNPSEHLPKGFVERTKEKGKLVSSVPQLMVLQHKATAVFVTNGGWNSVVESIISCVPMICRPLFGDQQLNTRCVEAIWGIGVEFEGGTITKEGTIKALELIFSAEDGKSMRTKLEALKELAFGAVQPSGSSTKNFNALVEVVTK